MNKKGKIKKIAFSIVIVAVFIIVIAILWYSKYYRDRQNAIVLKTQYTFSVEIDDNGNVLKTKEDNNIDLNDNESQGNISELTQDTNFGDLTIEQISNIWITEFLNQFQQQYISAYKAIKDVKINKISLVNGGGDSVLISFSCNPLNSKSEFFSSWDGYRTEGRLDCEWVVSFEMENLYNNTARIFAKSVQKPEAYGLSTAKAAKQETETKPISKNNKSTGKNLFDYEIKDNKIMVTSDGGEKWSALPVDASYFSYSQEDKNKLAEGSFVLGMDKTAFLYGGYNVSGKLIPLTIVYTDDRGSTWVNASVTTITDASYYYVNFFDNKNGIILVGYEHKNDTMRFSVLKTSDGGESWNTVNGQMGNTIQSALFITDKIGFVQYAYKNSTDNSTDSNLYMTTDGGSSFTPVILEEQQLSDTSTKLNWSSVYKDMQLPVLSDDGSLTLTVKQPSGGTYNGGDTMAVYVSNDNGSTWKYTGEE